MSTWQEVAKEFGAVDWAVGRNELIMTSDNTVQFMAEEIVRLRAKYEPEITDRLRTAVGACLEESSTPEEVFRYWNRVLVAIEHERAYSARLRDALKYALDRAFGVDPAAVVVIKGALELNQPGYIPTDEAEE